MNGDTIFVWQERTAEGWGIIAAMLEGSETVLPLVTRSWQAADTFFRMLADLHQQEAGNPIRLAEFNVGAILTEKNS